jgi:hypothetical protein
MASRVEAQTETPARVPGTLSGVVVDSLGIAVPEATVYVTELRRTTRTRDNGTFTFDGVKPGTYTVGAQAIGYISATGQVTVSAGGGVVRIEMTRVAATLQSMITTANRGGLSGVIGDTSYKAIAGVTIKVLGSGVGSAFTDSTGEFFLPVKPGHYMIRLERTGYARQLLSVTVPDREGRRISAWLTPQSEAASIMEGVAAFDLEQRLMRRSPMWSKVYTREDFATLNIGDAQEAVQRFIGSRPDNWACAYIDGDKSKRAPLWSLNAAEIELLEVYGSRNTSPARRGSKDPFKCDHWVWLRK